MKRTFVLIAAVAIMLTGCTPSQPEPTPSASASRSASPSASASPSPSAPAPTAAPIATPPPVAASTPLSAQSAFDICTRTVADTYATAQGGTADQFVYRSIDEATVIERDDGLFFVLVDFTNLVGSADLAEAGSAFCYIGETVEQPYFAAFGTVYRPTADQIDPYNPTPGGQA